MHCVDKLHGFVAAIAAILSQFKRVLQNFLVTAEAHEKHDGSDHFADDDDQEQDRKLRKEFQNYVKKKLPEHKVYKKLSVECCGLTVTSMK